MIVCSEVNLRTSYHQKKYCIISVIFVIVDFRLIVIIIITIAIIMPSVDIVVIRMPTEFIKGERLNDR